MAVGGVAGLAGWLLFPAMSVFFDEKSEMDVIIRISSPDAWSTRGDALESVEDRRLV